jgi:hypothetical protein
VRGRGSQTGQLLGTRLQKRLELGIINLINILTGVIDELAKHLLNVFAMRF